MLRTLELGRAVLCSPTTSLELWLTTLIKISLTEDDIDVQQLKSAQLLTHLASGDVCVERGHGMHLELKITLRDEPFTYSQLQRLAGSIIRAPAWKQLLLKPILASDVDAKLGILRLNIGHASNSEPHEGQNKHRLLANVPAADTRPSDGVPVVVTQSVSFCMDIVESRQSSRQTLKRLKTSSSGSGSVTTSLDATPSLRTDAASADIPLHGRTSNANIPPERIQEICPVLELSFGKHKRKQATAEGDQDVSEDVDVSNLIAGAIRLSVCGSQNKSANGLKVKANTFQLGLAAVDPITWRVDYLSALSQRARYLPTISRSLSQAAHRRATSMSLKHKMSCLAASSFGGQNENSTHQDTFVYEVNQTGLPSVTSHLWISLQKNILSRSMKLPQTFVATVSEEMHSYEDDMLADLEKQTGVLDNHDQEIFKSKICAHDEAKAIQGNAESRGILSEPTNRRHGPQDSPVNLTSLKHEGLDRRRAVHGSSHSVLANEHPGDKPLYQENSSVMNECPTMHGASLISASSEPATLTPFNDLGVNIHDINRSVVSAMSSSCGRPILAEPSRAQNDELLFGHYEQ